MLRPEVDCLRWLGGIADFEANIYGHIPFISDLAFSTKMVTDRLHNKWCAERLATTGDLNRYKELPMIEDRRHRIFSLSDAVWDQLRRIYGVQVGEVHALRATLSSWAANGCHLPFMIDNSAITRMVRMDEK
jgi:hypothetical protein